MKHMLRILIGIAVAMAVYGCSTFKRMVHGHNDVTSGMTMQQVEHLIGKPAMKNFDQSTEIWGYTDVANNIHTIAWITFVDGRVVRLDTQVVPPPPPADKK